MILEHTQVPNLDDLEYELLTAIWQDFFFFFQCIELHKCIQKFTLLNMSTFQTTSMKMGDKHIKVNSLMEIKCPKVELKVRRDVQISKNTKEQK